MSVDVADPHRAEEARNKPTSLRVRDVRLQRRFIVVNPGLKSDRDHRRRLTALQREVAGADQVAHYAVADPNRQAPQPHAGPRAVCLDALGRRRLDTRYIGWVAIRQRRCRRSSRIPRLKSSRP